MISPGTRSREPSKTYCLLGSSGVGKTTLLNPVIGREAFETQAVRENAGFADVPELAQHCRYCDCSHVGDAGCAVAAAVANGALMWATALDMLPGFGVVVPWLGRLLTCVAAGCGPSRRRSSLSGGRN